MSTQFLEVQSSNIARIGYDPERNVATVEFKTSAERKRPVWEYEGVSKETWDKWVAADSIGGFFHREIKLRCAGKRIS